MIFLEKNTKNHVSGHNPPIAMIFVYKLQYMRWVCFYFEITSVFFIADAPREIKIMTVTEV